MVGQKLESKVFEAIAFICFEYLDDGFGRDCVRDFRSSTNMEFWKKKRKRSHRNTFP
jgi:hypothetical protein